MIPTTCIHDMYPQHVIHDATHDMHPRHIIHIYMRVSHDVPHDVYPRRSITFEYVYLYINNPNDAFHDVVHDTWFVPMLPRCAPRHVSTTPLYQQS